MLNRSVSFSSLPLAVSAARRSLRLCLLGLLFFAACPLFADVNIKFDNLKEGDKISDISVIVVRAESSDGIDKVEFAVDDQLKFTTGSTPYTYKWDTIPEAEGKHGRWSPRARKRGTVRSAARGRAGSWNMA